MTLAGVSNTRPSAAIGTSSSVGGRESAKNSSTVRARTVLSATTPRYPSAINGIGRSRHQVHDVASALGWGIDRLLHWNLGVGAQSSPGHCGNRFGRRLGDPRFLLAKRWPAALRYFVGLDRAATSGTKTAKTANSAASSHTPNSSTAMIPRIAPPPPHAITPGVVRRWPVQK